LRATITGMPMRLYELLQKGRYRRVSAEIYPRFERSVIGKQLGGRISGMVLSAVALLGADIPEVKELNDVVEPLRAQDGDNVLCLAETEFRLEEEHHMNPTTYAETRREVRQFIERCPELFNGSVEVEGVTDPNVAEYLFLASAVADACHEAARDVAARFNLDMRQRDDYAEAYRILSEEDDSWSASSFDELSSAAQDRVLFAARRKMRTHLNGGFYGRPAARGTHVVMDDQFKHDREQHMLSIAKRDNLDLSTVDGRTVAYQRAADEHPHLKIPAGRNRVHHGFQLRRGQPATGEPVGPPLQKVGPGSPNRPFTEWPSTAQPKPSSPVGAAETDGVGGVGGNSY
jgi:hypothetical protein